MAHVGWIPMKDIVSQVFGRTFFGYRRRRKEWENVDSYVTFLYRECKIIHPIELRRISPFMYEHDYLGKFMCPPKCYFKQHETMPEYFPQGASISMGHRMANKNSTSSKVKSNLACQLKLFCFYDQKQSA